ncbi:MAG: Slp family lipoprotein [Thioalkalivibrio sp.]|nr:Slp family lipoprotein [Thioalkalivibrio sp.]
MRSADLTWLTMKLAGLFVGALLFAACATIPESLQPVPERQPSLAEVAQDPDGFLDPQVHTRLREVTVRGYVTGVTDGVIGAFPYTFPRVEAAAVHLWPPVPPEPQVIYRDPFWDPWGPWGPYWHPWRRGWW